jgi:MFS family permease
MSRDLILIGLALMTWGIGEGMFFYFQPLYLEQLGASPVVIGGILGAVGIAMTVAHVPAGYLADRVGRRPLMWLSWVMGLAAAWIMASARSLPVFVAGLLAYSATAFVMAPMNSYITAARGKLSVGRALTLVSVFYNIGAICGPWLGGQIGNHFGLQQIYRIAAGIFVFSVLIILLIRPQPVEHHLTAGTPARLKLDKRYLFYLAAVFFTMFAAYQPQPLSPNFLQNQRGLSVENIGQLGSIVGIGVVLLNLALGSLNARLGFLLAQAASGLFALILWQGRGFAWYAIGYFLIGGYRVARTLAAAQTRHLVDQAQMGLAYGITETVSASTIILAPPLAGYIYERNPEMIYILGSVLIGISLLVSARFIPVHREVGI